MSPSRAGDAVTGQAKADAHAIRIGGPTGVLSLGPYGYTPGVPEYSNHQKKIISRYYDQRDAIMLAKLQELVTELYLADSSKRKDQLWRRARTAMLKLKVKPGLLEHIVARRDPAILAQNVRDWLESAASAGEGKRPGK